MTNVLILGGTGWLSGRVARRWVDAGAEVTCLARGERSAPSGAVLVRGDRDDPEVYDDLALHDWDEVVDISSQARHVRNAVAALGHRTGHWTYVSSMSVYADDAAGGDENTPLLAAAAEGDEYEYGAQKVAAEGAVRALGDSAFIVRPGLIVGAGDPSDRFGYWAAAFARAGDGPVLLPRAEGRLAQVIDVEDLARFLTAAPRSGVVNAIGDPHPLDDVLERVRVAAGHTGELVRADDGWLEEHDVAYWMGERSLPLWLPADMPGFMNRSNAAYRREGGTLDPLDATIERVLADERERGVDRPRRAGLSREVELQLIGELDPK
ncbi:NAD-dependent epimerase/dehydratase family protein [Microbacterium sp.]|uniref:NAD-dependent epimerase/dehydratase family protein n=1 Tax=Microbacterium sp. TaxID=51671 RepID=UPI002811F260|nr:NAD-dependent epimerase/dehydratase family protein [Microbacterium sp.]